MSLQDSVPFIISIFPIPATPPSIIKINCDDDPFKQKCELVRPIPRKSNGQSFENYNENGFIMEAPPPKFLKRPQI